MRWIYFLVGILGIGFSLSLENNAVPNQEINLHFAASQSQTSSSKTITQFKSHLKKIGASQISIRELGEGTFQISYFSKLDIVFVKQFLEKEGMVLSETNDFESKDSFPFHEPSKDSEAQFRISKIQKGNPSNALGKGILVENQQSIEAVYHPILYAAFYAFGEVSSAYSEINSGIPASRSHTIVRKVPYTFPEVRAGPIV